LKFAVCLHGATVARAGLRLHQTDRHAILLGLSVGAQIVIVEAVGERGSGPVAAAEALEAGAHRAVRIVEPALAATDAHGTGLVLATALDHLDVDIVLWGDDADPEGLGDVPASIAHHMAALYLTGALALRLAESGPTDVDAVTVGMTVRSGAWLRELRVPLNAVVGVAAPATPPATASAGAPTLLGDKAATVVGAGKPPKKRPPVQVFTFADLGLDPALVRRRNDLRGVVEAAPRPLVTLQSAAAVSALLRHL
jgi:electron transfer flavoprotein beta subunit